MNRISISESRIERGPYIQDKIEVQENRWSHIYLKDAQVLHGQAIISAGKLWLWDATKLSKYGQPTNQWPGNTYEDQSGDVHIPIPTTPHPDLQEAYFLGGTNNLMHFVIEDIPRIRYFQKIDPNEQVPMLISNLLSVQIRQLIGILTRRPVIELGQWSVVNCSTLLVTHFRNALQGAAKGGEEDAASLFCTQDLSWARDKVLSFFSHDVSGPQRVVIAREPGLFRPMINSKQIHRYLYKTYGFSRILLAETSLASTVQAFRQANFIVGEYGAGLANMLFIEKPATLVELCGPLESAGLEYRALAEALGHKFHVVQGKTQTISHLGLSKGQFSLPWGLLQSKICAIMRKEKVNHKEVREKN